MRFKSCYHVEILAPDQVYLFAEHQTFLLEGKVYVLLAPFLKEKNLSAEDLASSLKDEAAPEEIYYALERLDVVGHLEKTEEVLDQSFSAFCHLLQVSPEIALQKLKHTKIFVAGPEKTKIGFSHLLRTLEMVLVDCSEKADLTVALTEDYLQEDLIEFHNKSYARNQPWMLVKPVGQEVWIGPFFIPQETGCLHCLRTHLQRNRFEEAFLQRKAGAKTPFIISRGSLEVTRGFAYHLAAVEIFKWIILGKSAAKGKLLSWKFLTNDLQEHQLTMLPHCSGCGTIKQTSFPNPPSLQSRKKVDVDDGGYRHCTPEATLQKNAHLVSPILGLVNSIAPSWSTNRHSLIQVFRSGFNFRVCHPQSDSLPPRRASFGKGKSPIQAKASCLCEALERYAMIYQGTEFTMKASYRKIQEDAIHPKSFLLFSDAQYREWQLNDPDAFKHAMYDTSHENEEIDWTPVWSLTQGRFKYIPTFFCYQGFLPTSARSNPNGVATGNCLEEAMLHGLFELIERDSHAIWWYNGLDRPQVDLESFNDPYFHSSLELYRTLHRELWVLDISSDLKMPCFAAISKRIDKKEEEIFYGFGAHLDAKIAITRAITEMNQKLDWTFWEREEKEILHPDDMRMHQWLTYATTKNLPFLGQSKNRISASSYPKYQSTDLLKDLKHCQAILENAGMEVLMLDLSRPEINLSIVNMIVPGLRQVSANFAPGRIYDVPVKMGLLSTPKTENELYPQEEKTVPEFYI
jgi:bacteriocin biosynthesis cyclodehydratase domain-containing protein